MFFSCRDSRGDLSAQQIVDRAIDKAGGVLYGQSEFKFRFRDREYALERKSGRKVLMRMNQTDSGTVTDTWDGRDFRRDFKGEVLPVADTMARAYSNSVNSVHYFAYLPYGLNDAAVNKKRLEDETIKGRPYYKIEVTFDQEGGGEDFEDVYIYWIDRENFTTDYLAYVYHVDGGGIRFREAFNERYINGIRFVDYRNFNPVGEAEVSKMGALFEAGELELLSVVRLEDIKVSRGSYN
jgi:hypothetical protein